MLELNIFNINMGKMKNMFDFSMVTALAMLHVRQAEHRQTDRQYAILSLASSQNLCQTMNGPVETAWTIYDGLLLLFCFLAGFGSCSRAARTGRGHDGKQQKDMNRCP